MWSPSFLSPRASQRQTETPSKPTKKFSLSRSKTKKKKKLKIAYLHKLVDIGRHHLTRWLWHQRTQIIHKKCLMGLQSYCVSVILEGRKERFTTSLFLLPNLLSTRDNHLQWRSGRSRALGRQMGRRRRYHRIFLNNVTSLFLGQMITDGATLGLLLLGLI